MASSSVERGAARAPLPANQLAAFYKLVDKQVTAAVLCRHARDADLSSQASSQAESLYGDDSLVVASLWMNECAALTNLAYEAGGAEKEALLRRSWGVLVSVVNLLLRRLEANTLLPGTIREEELNYEAYAQAAHSKAKNKPVPSPVCCAPWFLRWDTTFSYKPCTGACTYCRRRIGRLCRRGRWSCLCSKASTSSLEQPAYTQT